MFKPEGIIPAMITPFTENDEINEQAIRQLVNRFIDAGAHGIFCLGTNGEFFSLSYDEKVRIAEIVADETKGRVAVYMGTGGISTKEVVKLSREMERLKIDALSVITPYFLPFSQKELLYHYHTLSASTSLPILLYNIPSRTGVSLEPNTVGELSKLPNIVGIKDSSGNFDNILQYLDRVDPDFSVLAGTDSLILWTLLAGGKGAIAATANLAPQLVVSIYECWKNGQITDAQKFQNQLRPIRAAIQQGTLPSALKATMNMLGLPAGNARAPVSPTSDKINEELLRLIKFTS
ncbi:4-hydroxy-tetrahydrodipicolinate synthase [Paenibacillus sp. LMG 31456]|uniref:4-hydroxy-tetrahydrodipicolinate synthase n=1 Tax=Paenibacillus foliorum TaxID=2654974 RepID=A0A972GLV2_9BACL|nr:4-hydroxy-tetrahydrodipicolinate synthase [Paenibacillus foliorum]NOU93124.1 4-hydroxy-tetrahydrodipicolinate synthase [Paenibacillus foliorum]